MKTRLYHLIALSNKTGRKVRLTGYPMQHKECMQMKSRFHYSPARTILLEEVQQ